MSVLTLCCWFALIWSAGWFFLPFSRQIFGDLLPDGGVAVGRVLFLATWTLLAFWLGHMGLPISMAAFLWIFIAAAGLFIGKRDKAIIQEEMSGRRKAIRASETIFLLVFLGFFLLRGFWSDTDGTNGEKSMDSALIGSLARAQKLPPPNPYSAGAQLGGYYYFGHLQTALLTDATGTTVRWSYNLMCATLPALCFSVLFSLGAGVTGRLKGGAFVSATVLGLGTLEPIIQWRNRQLFGPSTPFGLDHFATSRVIPYSINEYPWFTFNQADLHGHYFDFPFALTTMCLAYALYKGRKAALFPATFVLGAQILTNTWDFPAYGILLGLAVLCGARFLPGQNEVVSPEEVEEEKKKSDLGARLGRMALLLVGALLVASLYLVNLKTAADPPRALPQPASPLREWLMLWGPFAAAWLTFCSYTVFQNRWQRTVCLGLICSVLIVACSSSWFAPEPALYVGSPLILPLIGLLIGVSIWGAVTLRDNARFLCFLAVAGLLALLWSETTWAGFLGDPNNPGFNDYKRQDTVFKFGLQVWMLWGVAASCGVYLTLRKWPEALKCVFIAPLPVMVLASVSVVFGRTHNFLLWNDQGRWLGPLHLSPSDPTRRENHIGFWGGWDGWAHLWPAEKGAATWLMQNTPPGDNIIEAENKPGGDYTNFTRYANATGIPTVIGPQAHSFQWSPADGGKKNPDWEGSLKKFPADKIREFKKGREWDEVFRRKADVRAFYLETDPAARREILARYHVRYIVFGELELAEYGPQALDSLRNTWPQVATFGKDDDPHRVWIFATFGD